MAMHVGLRRADYAMIPIVAEWAEAMAKPSPNLPENTRL
jgi:hypothetical protein